MNDPSYVLVVEDSPTQAAQMQMLLEEAGYRIRVAADGKAGRAQALADPPALVVTDLRMPEMNGLELVEALKQELPRTPVILTTAEGSEDIAAEALSKGAVSYVPKRSLQTLLVSTVQQILSLLEPDLRAQQLIPFQVASEVTYALTNDPHLVPVLVAHMRELTSQFDLCDARSSMPVATALDEALVNAMIHGNLEVPSNLREVDHGAPYHALIRERQQASPYGERRVHVRMSISSEEATFVIRDEGPGFDPSGIPDPLDPVNLERIGGRGLLLIHTFMDEVAHNEQGNQITMIKRRG